MSSQADPTEMVMKRVHTEARASTLMLLSPAYERLGGFKALKLIRPDILSPACFLERSRDGVGVRSCAPAFSCVHVCGMLGCARACRRSC